MKLGRVFMNFRREGWGFGIVGLQLAGCVADMVINLRGSRG